MTEPVEHFVPPASPAMPADRARLRLPQRLNLLALPWLLAACSQLPHYQRPAVTLPAQWPASGALQATAVPVDNGDWADYFSDARLQPLIAQALANNRDLRVTALKVEQARAQFQISRANQWPALNAVAGGSRAPMVTAMGTVQGSSYSVGLTVTAFELDFFGRVASLKEQALAQYLGSTQAYESARLSLIASVATGWLTLLADEAQLALLRETMLNLEATLQLTQRAVRHGTRPQQDLLQAESQAQAARAALAQGELQRQRDENALQLLLGLPDSVPLHDSLDASTLDVSPWADLAPDLPSELLLRRPDVAQAEQSLIAANANVGAARAALFPRISLTAGISSLSPQLSGLFKSGSQGFTLPPQASLPLWDAGQSRAQVEASKAGRDIATAQYEKAIHSAFREVADALAQRQAVIQQLDAAERQAAAAQAQAKLAQRSLEMGASSRLDWLASQRNWLSQKQQRVQAQLNRLQNQVSVYQVLGGHWRGDRSPSGPT